MIPGLETVAQAKGQKADLEVAELKMLRFCLGVTGLDICISEGQVRLSRWLTKSERKD